MEFVKLNSITAFEQAINAIDSESKLVVCGEADKQEYIEENSEFDNRSTEEIIKATSQVDVPQWFASRKQQYLEEWQLDLAEIEGEWPGEIKEKMGFTLANDILSGKPLNDLIGAKLPAKHHWQLPAYFKYGGWNECPEAATQCAVWKFWEEKYGAKIVGVSTDIIEAQVYDPPTTQAEAMQLAWQQYLYCNDIVDQGVETIANLAATLINDNCWYFWWD
ncbi:MAG: DUF4253 domain-containing protein [Kangiellaceae bacterium]|nr:DUF4253 domain-containing protein [Kangiellaceae bacterium]MCW8997931.1 DUF4253 domain-containing protein [Kangiellaceae bacterium]